MRPPPPAPSRPCPTQQDRRHHQPERPSADPHGELADSQCLSTTCVCSGRLNFNLLYLTDSRMVCRPRGERPLRHRVYADGAEPAIPCTAVNRRGRCSAPAASGAQHTAGADGGGRRRRCGWGPEGAARPAVPAGRARRACGAGQEGVRGARPPVVRGHTLERPTSFLPGITVLRPPGPGMTTLSSRARWSLGPPCTRPGERRCPSCRSACRRESWATSRPPW